MSLLFGVYEKFFVKHPVYDISFQCDIVLLFELRESFSLGSEFLLSLSKSKIFSCGFFYVLVSDEQRHVCVHLCVGVLL